MRKTLSIFWWAPGLLAGQVCSLVTTSNCPTTGVPQAGPPTLGSFVTGAALALSATRGGTARLPQPRMIFSGQVVPASASYMTFDPMTCPNSGTCHFNNISTIESYVDSLTKQAPKGVGMTSLDVNLWLGPMFEASQYGTACAAGGACYTPGSSGPNYAAWYTQSLATYDALFAYAASKHVLMRVAPTPTSDVLHVCGIATGAGNFTEAQLENCLKPLYVVLAERYRLDYVTVIHEVCGLWATRMGTSPNCAMNVADTDTFVRGTAAAVRAASQNSAIKIGAGALLTDAGGFPYSCANSGNYWCDWVNLMSSGVLDFGGIDVYPDTSIPASSYYSSTLANTATLAAQVPAGKEVWANESSALRWTPIQSRLGEDSTYWGCGSAAWLTGGVFAAWAESVPGAWAPAHGFRGWSIFTTEPLLYVSSDAKNTHCTSISLPGDTYDESAMTYAGQVSAEGQAYAQVVQGWNVSLQGNARLTGRVRLGH